MEIQLSGKWNPKQIGETCKDSQFIVSATQELGYTGDTLTLHWKNVRYGVHRHGAGSKIGGAVK